MLLSKNQVLPVHKHRQTCVLFRPYCALIQTPAFLCLCTGKTWNITGFWGHNQAYLFFNSGYACEWNWTFKKYRTIQKDILIRSTNTSQRDGLRYSIETPMRRTTLWKVIQTEFPPHIRYPAPKVTITTTHLLHFVAKPIAELQRKSNLT